MANNARVNPMIADTASSSRLVNDSTVVMISGIQVYASASTWVVILKDGAGNIIFRADNVAGNNFRPTVPFITTGLVVDTLTAAIAYIYTVPS